MSAGLDRHGPAASDYVGRVEAAAMVRAWRSARRQMSRTPALDMRWTRICFCGQDVDGRPVASQSAVGIPFLTGSEEERGPLFDVTQEHFEGRRAPVDDGGPHGHKIRLDTGGVPRGVPLLAVRVGRRMIVSLPGRGHKGGGRAHPRGRGRGRSRARGSRAWWSPASRTSSSSTSRPRRSTTASTTRAATPTSAGCRRCWCSASWRSWPATWPAARRRAAPFAFDSKNGVAPDGPPYSAGAASGAITAQPGAGYGAAAARHPVVERRRPGPGPARSTGPSSPLSACKARPLGHPGLRPRPGDAVEGGRRRAAIRWHGRSRSTRRAAPTASW